MPLRWLSTIEGVPGEPSGFSFFEGKPAKSMALEPFRQLAKGSATGAVVHSPGAKLFAANCFGGGPRVVGALISLKAVCSAAVQTRSKSSVMGGRFAS